MTSSVSPWPDLPYRGLNYFRPQDRPLFAGRDHDVEACSSLLAHPRTRVLLLHGLTGCGKSSFLRAGLIPAMEDEGAGYLFLKVPGTDDEAIFIRSTEAPIDQIIRQVYLFCSSPFRIRTPTGYRQLDLGHALLGANSWEAYLDKARANDGLIESLRRISEIIPQTLVLIIDQAEEVLTLNHSEAAFINRVHFFHLLRLFQELEFDARIIVTLRTEYYGRFIDAIRTYGTPSGAFEQFLLAELSASALLEAVLRPTHKEVLGTFGIPYEQYRFSFDERLPQCIVTDILKARYSGPALPVLQLVCLYLYSGCKKQRKGYIEFSDYKMIGQVAGILTRHVSSVIESLYDNNGDFLNDSLNIIKFLNLFYIVQDNRSIVARAVELTTAQSKLSKCHLLIDSNGLISTLTSPQTMILRIIRSTKSDGEFVNEITLAHDSIGEAIELWKSLLFERKLSEQQARHEIVIRRSKFVMFLSTYMAAFLGIIASFVAIYSLKSAIHSDEVKVNVTILVTMAMVPLLVLISNFVIDVYFESTRKLSRRLYDSVVKIVRLIIG